MDRLVLLLPGLLGPESDSVLADAPPRLRLMASRGEVHRIDLAGSNAASMLGLDPDRELQPGPLAVAALGVRPPDRSVQFRMTLASLTENQLSQAKEPLSESEANSAVDQLAKLHTRRLTTVKGHALEHALVWEDGSLELGTTGPDAFPTSYSASLPEGDGESLLRRFIDDSVNILSDLEFNLRRIDEGRQPVNCAWPWGQGFRAPVENLSLAYGVPARVESGSIDLAGYSLLAGLQHGDWTTFDRGTATPLALLGTPSALLFGRIGAFERFRGRAEVEEMAWFLHEIDDKVLARWFEQDGPTMIALVAMGQSEALGLVWSNESRSEGWIPFDERALQEKIPVEPLHKFIRRAAL